VAAVPAAAATRGDPVEPGAALVLGGWAPPLPVVDAVGDAGDLELVEVVVLPAHGHLHHTVQLRQRDV